MCRYFIILLLILFSSLLIANEFVVDSFEEQQNDLSLQRTPKKDVNGDLCGLIKISTDITGITFPDKDIVNIQAKTGEYWIYVSPGKKYLKLTNAGYAAYMYSFPNNISIQSDCVYSLKLKSKGASAVDENLLLLTLKMNVSDVVIIKNGTSSNIAKLNQVQYRLPAGEYNFKFVKQGYANQEITVKMDKQEETRDITLVAGQSQEKIKLPGIVMISSEPNQAEVFINNQKVGVTPYTDEVIAGDHQLMLRKNLYDSYSSAFKVVEGQTVELPLIKMTPKYGYYAVQSVPEGARIFLDGKLVGISPIPRNTISSGAHQIKAEMEMYHPKEQEVIIKNGDDKNIAVNLTPAFGILEITSYPETGGKVFIDDKEVGLTPYLNPKMMSGSYQVRIEKLLWIGEEQTVSVSDNQTTMKQLTLTKNYGILHIQAEGADIYLNDEKVGTGEYSPNLLPGKYTIRAEKDRHKAASEEVYLSAGDEKTIILKVEPLMAAVSVISFPEDSKGAEIYLNDQKADKQTPSVLPLLIGDYTISLKHPKYLEQSQTISLKEGDSKKLVFQLQSYEGSRLQMQSKWRTQKYVALGILALDMAAATIGYTQGNSNYDKYKSATTSATATDFYDKSKKYDQIAVVTICVSPLPLSWFIYSCVKQHRYADRR